jgi:integrase
MSSKGCVYSWCGCRDKGSGNRMGARCPLRGKQGHGSWYLSLELPPALDGSRRRIRRGGFPTRQDAEAALTRLWMPSPSDRCSSLLTVGQWLEHWLVSRTAPRSSTLRGYATHVRLYLAPCLGQILLADLSPGHVQAMFTAICRQHEAMGRSVTTATLVRVKATLRTALNAAIRAGHVTTNAASRAELPPSRRPKAAVWTAGRVSEWERTGIRPPVAVWTPAQTATFLNSIHQHRLYAAYHLIALRGLRRGEACGLRSCDVDLDSGTAIISWQLQQYDGHVVLCPPKTAHSERVIALDRTTVAVLRAHRSRQLAECAAAGADYLASGYVFTRLNGDPMAPDWLSRYFRQLNDASGLPPIRLHDLRHGAASLALAAGADLKVIQDMLGHSSIVLTADTYTSVPGTQERRRPAVRRLRQRAQAAITAGLSRAHPARQIATPSRQHGAVAGGEVALPGSAGTPIARRAAIPWPTSAHTSAAA